MTLISMVLSCGHHEKNNLSVPVWSITLLPEVEQNNKSTHKFMKDETLYPCTSFGMRGQSINFVCMCIHSSSHVRNQIAEVIWERGPSVCASTN